MPRAAPNLQVLIPTLDAAGAIPATKPESPATATTIPDLRPTPLLGAWADYGWEEFVEAADRGDIDTATSHPQHLHSDATAFSDDDDECVDGFDTTSPKEHPVEPIKAVTVAVSVAPPQQSARASLAIPTYLSHATELSATKPKKQPRIVTRRQHHPYARTYSDDFTVEASEGRGVDTWAADLSMATDSMEMSRSPIRQPGLIPPLPAGLMPRGKDDPMSQSYGATQDTTTQDYAPGLSPRSLDDESFDPIYAYAQAPVVPHHASLPTAGIPRLQPPQRSWVPQVPTAPLPACAYEAHQVTIQLSRFPPPPPPSDQFKVELEAANVPVTVFHRALARWYDHVVSAYAAHPGVPPCPEPSDLSARCLDAWAPKATSWWRTHYTFRHPPPAPHHHHTSGAVAPHHSGHHGVGSHRPPQQTAAPGYGPQHRGQNWGGVPGSRSRYQPA